MANNAVIAQPHLTPEQRERLRNLRRNEPRISHHSGLRDAILDMAIRYGSACQWEAYARGRHDEDYHHRARRRRFAALQRLLRRVNN